MQASQQAALVELGQSALVGTDLPTLMRQAAGLVAHTLGVEYSKILELLPDGSVLVLRAGVGWAQGAVEHTMVGLGATSHAWHTLSTGMPVIVADWRSETRFGQPPLLRDHQVVSSLCVVIHGQRHPFGVLGADSTRDRSFSDDDVRFLQAVANVLAMAIERMQAEESLRTSLEQRVEERTREIERRHQVDQSLHDILTILNSNRALDEILDYIIRQACQLLDTPVGAIYSLNRQEAMLHIQASRGLDVDDAALNLPVGWGAVGQAVLERRPVVVTDTSMAFPDHCCEPPAAQAEVCLTRLSNRYRSLLAVPLIVKADVYGAITLYYHEPRAFSDEEVRLAITLCDQAALAIENARLVAAAQGKAVLEERQRLARDLHDSVTQSLYGITLQAEAATRLLSSGDLATTADYLRGLQDTAQEALEEMRLLIFELRPPVLEQEGLVAALQARLGAVEGRANLETSFVVEGVRDLPALVEQALYRISQEALNNALKHAHAQHISIALRQGQSAVILEISDDGVGFAPAAARETGGLGLRGMEERVAELGGRIILQSAPGAGTRVRVEIAL